MNKKYFLKNSKILISLMTLFCFNSTLSSAGINNKNLINTDKIVISGTIKDETGNPLEKASIFFDSTEVAVTDKDGKFSFELNGITPNSHSVYFSSESFVTVVRSYYPVMLSTSYDIILRRQFSNVKTAVSEPVHIVKKDSVHAITIQLLPIANKDSVHLIKNQPLPAAIKRDSISLVSKDSSHISNAIVADELDLPSIIFNKNGTALTSLDKAFLDIISEKLKNHPAIKIDIKAYTPEHDFNLITAQNRLKNIVKYLVAKGIASERLNTDIIAGGGDLNTVDLFNRKSK
jgi:hypothetical protein